MTPPGCTSNRSQMRKMASMVPGTPFESPAMVVEKLAHKYFD